MIFTGTTFIQQQYFTAYVDLMWTAGWLFFPLYLGLFYGFLSKNVSLDTRLGVIELHCASDLLRLLFVVTFQLFQV